MVFPNCTDAPCMLPNDTGERRLMAWVGANINDPEQSINCRLTKEHPTCLDSIIHQLETNRNLFTGLYAFCGYSFAKGGKLITEPWDGKPGHSSGAEYVKMITPMMKYCVETGIEFHPVINFDDPADAEANPQLYIESFAAAAKEHGWSGWSMDWELPVNCSKPAIDGCWDPIGNVVNFTRFVDLSNKIADGLHQHGLAFTSAVQWITKPWNSKPAAELSALLSSSTVDKWLSMDTYYFGTARVIDALDFYMNAVKPASKVGIGMSHLSAHPSEDGFIARFHALRALDVKEVDMFFMPVNSSWLPWLRKWKNDVRGCPNSGVLSAWANPTCF